MGLSQVWMLAKESANRIMSDGLGSTLRMETARVPIFLIMVNNNPFITIYFGFTLSNCIANVFIASQFLG
jgi:hypothetical protein